tara:strand:- start:6749 stop:7342 length:594 start_codon:yes stop_codon:yes gene_type:complete
MNSFTALCLECHGNKFELDYTQNKIDLKESLLVVKDNLYRKACVYEYQEKRLFLYIEDDQTSRTKHISPHNLPYPMDDDIIYGNIIFILEGGDFTSIDFKNFIDLNIFAMSPSNCTPNTYNIMSRAIRKIPKIDTAVSFSPQKNTNTFYENKKNRSDSVSSYKTSRSFESQNDYLNDNNRSRCSSLSFGSSIDFSKN